ncbi:MAG: hypothetical protein EOO75_11610 [Myxococcales bacterium]|nr:MAG: hypothetical protein EOO75_11610 [Myxococcales bacterium]
MAVQRVGSPGALTVLLSVAAEPDGSLLVGGWFRGSFEGLPGTPLGDSRALWARVPASGAPSWVRTAPTADKPGYLTSGAVPEVMIDAQGGEHVILVERGTFDVGLGPHTSTDFQNVGDLFVLDLGPEGSVTAQRLVASGVENDVGRYEVQAQADADGLVLCGSFRVQAGAALGSDQDAGGKGQVYVARLAP